MRKKLLSPVWVSVFSFVFAIITGAAFLLHADSTTAPLSVVDALFTATSAVCVTGLSVVDTGTHFTRQGHWIIVLLIQAGGLGIMTYSSLLVYLLRKRVSLQDRLAVGQALLHNPAFSLRSFLLRMCGIVFAIEMLGTIGLWKSIPGMSLFSSFFHAVSAFCNAGFSLNPDSLSHWQGSWGILSIFAALIICGGLGFTVLDECVISLRALFVRWAQKDGKSNKPLQTLSYSSRIVLSTTFFLLLGGTILLWAAEAGGGNTYAGNGLAVAFFQSVTCRTAGFNTVPIHEMTNVALFFLVLLMCVGGASGSCAGGMKVTSLRILLAFIKTQILGEKQVVVGGKAISQDTLRSTLTLFTLAIILVGGATLVLSVLEGGEVSHPQARGEFLELLFEAASAFSTTGLSTGSLDSFSNYGKCVLIGLMIVGRIGPIWLLSALQYLREPRRYQYPEASLPVG